MATKKTVTIDEWVKQHEGNVAEAARAAGVDYTPFYRWHARKVFSPNHSMTRQAMAEKGIELPRRPR